MTDVTWIVVAESSRARIYGSTATDGELVELADLVHPESRLHEQDLTADLPGRTHDRQGAGRHAMEDRTDVKVHEAEQFAQQIGLVLNTGYRDAHFQKLVLAAPPKFLGMLRKQLSNETLKIVTQEVDKNLLHESPESIKSYL